MGVFCFSSRSNTMSLNGSTDEQKLDDLSTYTYKNQAIWFLNAFWNSFAEKEAENIWAFVHHCNDLDLQDHEAGNHLDEMMAHRFLELIHSTLTVREMRDGLRAVGIEKVKHVPLVNFLIFKYKVDWHALVNASQGDNQEEVAEAQKAKAELDAALADLKAEEDAYNNKTKELERKSEEGGVVSRNKAKAELAQHLATDPLPLRRAKITCEAAVKKAERTATEAAEARAAADAALADAEKSLAEAEAYLQEVKSKPGCAAGALWWIDPPC